MGKRGWFTVVRRALSSSYLRDEKNKKSRKSNSTPQKQWQGNQMSLDSTKATLASFPNHYLPIYEPVFEQPLLPTPNPTPTHLPVSKQAKNEPMDEDTTSRAPTEVNFMTPAPHKTREDVAAIKIQTAYREYLVRMGSSSLRAQRRLKLLMQGQSVKRQTTSTLKRIQTTARVQSQVRTREVRMGQVNRALQRGQKQAYADKYSDKGGWDLSPRSKEQADANLRRKKEANERREKVLAFSSTRQQTWRKNMPKSGDNKNTDVNFEDWGWNWSARWDAVRPWDGTKTNMIGKQVSRQSPPSSPTSKVVVAKSASLKGSVKPVKPKSPILNRGSSVLGSGKKRGPSQGAQVGSPKKRVVNSGSSRINTNTKK